MFSDILPDAMKTTCAQCSPKQIELIYKMSHAIMTQQNDVYDQILDKYDPKGKYRAAFHKYIEENSKIH